MYDMTVRDFLLAIDRGLLPADVTMDTPASTSCSFDYYDGCLLAEVNPKPETRNPKPEILKRLVVIEGDRRSDGGFRVIEGC